jgi:hypothetical protein
MKGLAMTPNGLDRRAALQHSLAAGLLAALPATAAAQAAQGPDDPKKKLNDRELVLDCGLTEEEADCWELIAKAAGKFFELPKLHPMDAGEVASAVHVIQHKLLARPTYRKYLELAKKQKP